MRLLAKLTLFSFASILALSTASGCRDKSDAPESRLLRGRVKGIDTTSGIVTGSFWNKKGEEMELSGKLSQDAEILIDGRTANLDEVQIGDAVEVEGYEEKDGTERRLIAKKVRITRSAPGSAPMTQPATTTQPAAAGAGQ